MSSSVLVSMASSWLQGSACHRQRGDRGIPLPGPLSMDGHWAPWGHSDPGCRSSCGDRRFDCSGSSLSVRGSFDS
jgi:hypothetical protein